jgi:hypothetical protein
MRTHLAPALKVGLFCPSRLSNGAAQHLRYGGKSAAMTGTERVRSIESVIAEIAHSRYPEATSADISVATIS